MFVHKPLALVASALLLCVAPACATTKSKTSHAPTPHAAGQEKQSTREESPAEKGRVMREDGWEVPGLAAGVQMGERGLFRASSAAAPQIDLTWLRPTVKGDDEFLIDDNYFREDERKALRLLPGRLAVIKIARYDVNQKPFCYVVFVHPQGVGATNGLAYYDEDGDGKFEVIERASVLPSFLPRLPAWAQPAH